VTGWERIGEGGEDRGGVNENWQKDKLRRRTPYCSTREVVKGRQ
jgi:hypothetical protein